MPINFLNIHPYKGSQRDAFEELVCQIARRTFAAGDSTWRRLDGSGGDGGVEAYYDPPSGRVGIQAKYFTKTADIGWSQILDSFRTALSVHPALVSYRIYIACDLTGPTRQPGKTGVQRWAEVRETLKAIADEMERVVDVDLNTSSDILSELARPECVGLAGFWFGALEITAKKLRAWQNASIAALGERFHPEDHVQVRAQQLVRVLSRSPLVVNELRHHFANLPKLAALEMPEVWRNQEDKIAGLAAVQIAQASLVGTASDIDSAATTWPIEQWRELIATARTSIRNLLSELHSDWDTLEKASSFRQALIQRNDALEAFAKFLDLPAFTAELDRVGVVVGPAGSGKSHLLAACGEEVLAENGVCVLLLGHRFNNEHLWTQIVGQLGLSPTISADELLGALDAAASAARRRGVLIIDAVNEGALRQIWRREFTGFADLVRSYRNLSFVVSCRDVFVPHVLGENVEQKYSVSHIRGFATTEEQEQAAKVYMDRRGITRPAVPWLAPEFVNPLFLRSCCSALQADGQHEFPAGLIGTKKLLSFYVTALSRAIMLEADSLGDISIPCKRALVAIGRAMAVHRADWLARYDVTEILSSEFITAGYPDHDWTATLIRSGILREDPHPEGVSGDPLLQRPDVIRFAFQRFQDHLMAEALLIATPEIDQAFQRGGNLAFVLSEHGYLRWEWNGLIEALAIQVPEKYAKELVDVLPDGDRHWRAYDVQQAFLASVRWREASAISPRTLALANMLNGNPGEIASLLIELAPRIDHPWNAVMFDRNLHRWKYLRRDQLFTTVISNDGLDPEHPVNRLVDWCASAPKQNADPRAIRLCGLMLSWLCATTAPELRDRATKALSSLFTDVPALMVEFISHFAMTDDLYVLERVLAAAYGMLIRHGSGSEARVTAEAVWREVLSQQRVPENLLLRDYAVGIIDLAGSLDKSFDVSNRRMAPPFNSPVRRIRLSSNDVERIADKAGGREILYSCTSEIDDFYKNNVRYRVERFASVPLSREIKLSSRQIAFRFEDELKRQSDSSKWKALRRIRQLVQRPIALALTQAGLSLTLPAPSTLSASVRKAERALFALLTPKEAQVYREHWRPWATGKKVGFAKYPRPNAKKSGLWIAREAYRMGWTAERFPRDKHLGRTYDTRRASLERIGQKYQWLARSKLLCALADNYWLADESDDGGAKSYRYATDISFERDVDPSLYDHASHVDGGKIGLKLGLTAVVPVIDPRADDARLTWPCQFDFSACRVDDPIFSDANGERWVRLTWHVSADRRSIEQDYLTHNLLQEEFSFTHAVLCRPSDAPLIQNALRAAEHIDILDWNPPEYTDGPFFYEHWRANWPNQQWRVFSRYKENFAFPIAYPVEEYFWESHLDGSLPQGARGRILAPWLLRFGQLHVSPQSADIIEDAVGHMVGWNHNDSENGGFVVREDWFLRYLEQENLTCLWVTVGERNAWGGAERRTVVCRRFNSVMYLKEGRPYVRRWYEDIDTRHCSPDSPVVVDA